VASATARWLPTTVALALALGPALAGAEEALPAIYHLAGSMDPGVAVQVELQIGKERITGSLVRAGDDRAVPLDGTVLADGHVELYLRGDFGRLAGTIRGTLRQEGPSGAWVLTGERRDDDGLNPRPLTLTEVARYVTLRARQGDDLDVSCRYPVLLGTSPAIAEVNRRAAAEAMSWLGQALAGEASGGPAPRGLRYEDTLVSDTPRLVSRLVRIETAGGTAPPRVAYRAENLEVVDGRVTPLRLGELFRAGSPYRQVLATRALEELLRVVAPGRVGGAVARLREEDLQTFAVSPSALQFVVPAARAGTPGPDDVLVSVPLAGLAGLLDPQGPLGSSGSASR
jgi:hypothetical protein